MNKDVIYIEPEDDITDIISKLKGSKQKVVALVPPKKAGVLRSAVNTKLIAKTAKNSEKAVVIVTTDPSLVKLSAIAGIPVAETLQSRPKLPSDFTPEELNNLAAPISIDGRNFDDDSAETPKKASESSSNASGAKMPNNTANAENTPSKASKKPDQELKSTDLDLDDAKKSKKTGKKQGKIPNLDKYRKFIIPGAILLVALIGFFIWATFFSASVSIAVNVRTTANNFAENVSFTTKSSSEDASKGIFYLESQEIKKENSVEFTATGSKDVGEKAHGTLQVGVYAKESVNIPAGTRFSTGDLAYTADSGASIKFSDDSKCENSMTDVAKRGCLLTASVAVTATESGEKYNVASGRTWTSNLSAETKISNSAAFSGGTTKTVIVVQQSDINNAKTKLEQSSDSVGKEELAKAFGDDMLVIDSSFKATAGDAVSNPSVGAEVPEGTTPKITSAVTYSMLAVSRNKVNDFIKDKTEASLSSDQKVYDLGSPFFERFMEENGNYTAKLKTTTKSGPKVTEEDILEKSKGRKIGEVQSILQSVNGVSSVKITPSYFWVHSVPDDPNRITIELKVEE
ncbi:hypothetical protein IJH74_00990 [Candidatus Saccharibacteria bacterium]|nr:hypothetical protein [Candidatus Saccharibacteria bacterium]